MFGGDATLAVDQPRLGKDIGLAERRHSLRGVGQSDPVVQRLTFEEWAHDVPARFIERHAEHGETVVPECVFEFLEPRHLDLARSAPGCPEVQQQDPSGVVGEHGVAAVRVRQREVRRVRSLVGRCQIRFGRASSWWWGACGRAAGGTGWWCFRRTRHHVSRVGIISCPGAERDDHRAAPDDDGRADQPQADRLPATLLRAMSVQLRQPLIDIRLLLCIWFQCRHPVVRPTFQLWVVVCRHSVRCTPSGTPPARDAGGCRRTRA